jgi:hypothetical protein
MCSLGLFNSEQIPPTALRMCGVGIVIVGVVLFRFLDQLRTLVPLLNPRPRDDSSSIRMNPNPTCTPDV